MCVFSVPVFMGSEQEAGGSLSAELAVVLDAQNNAILTAVNAQIQGLQTNLLQAQSDLAVQITSDLQPDTYVFKKKGNEQQFSFNRKVAKTSGTALKALESENIPKAKEELNKGISLINSRQKIIKLADKSEFGWATVQEYVSDELADDKADSSKIKKAEKRAAVKITVRINTVANHRGPGFWKLNTHLLTESEYINLIRKTITEVSKEYEGHKEVDEILLWDVIKMQIRATSIKNAKEKKSCLKQKENFLEKEILALKRKLEENNPSEPHKEILQTELRIKNQQLEEIIGYKTQGAILRSKVKWYNEGERNTKYFHSLE